MSLFLLSNLCEIPPNKYHFSILSDKIYYKNISYFSISLIHSEFFQLLRRNENVKLFVFLFEKYFCTPQNNIYPIPFFDDMVLHKTSFRKQCNEPVGYINTTTETYICKTNRVCKNTTLSIPLQTPSHFRAFFYSLLWQPHPLSLLFLSFHDQPP